MTPLAAPGNGRAGDMLGGDAKAAPAGNRGLFRQPSLELSGGIGLMSHPSQDRTLVRQSHADRTWLVECPCGFTWHTRWHRLALLMAVNHHHEAVTR